MRKWLEERYDWSSLRGFARKKFVPVHKYDLWYYTGGAVLFLFAVQFVTGMVLAFYYIPYYEQAHKSVIEIVTKLNMGWFFRSLHHWGAQFAIGFLFIHLFGTLLLKSYRKPREMLWFSGFILLGFSIFFGLSGYFLLWDERAFAAVRVATGGISAFPIIGETLKAFLRGGIDVTGETLIRFYAFHVCVLPISFMGLVVLHLFLVQYHGMSIPRSQDGRALKQVPFFPNVVYKDLMFWVVLIGIVVTFATLIPPEIGTKADPLAPPPENVKPEWYFLFLFQTLKLFPGDLYGLNGEVVAVLLVAMAILFFFLVPFFDRKSQQSQRSPVFTVIGVVYLLYFVVMTVVGYFS